MTKKGLDVTTKGWTKEELKSLEKGIKKQNFKWVAKCIDKTGKIKWFHSHTKMDVEILAIQGGYKILKVTQNR